MSKTILVVDDDEEIVKLISKTLRYEQFAVITASSGEKLYLRWRITLLISLFSISSCLI